jgi:hypothetical protein
MFTVYNLRDREESNEFHSATSPSLFNISMGNIMKIPLPCHTTDSQINPISNMNRKTN